MAKAIRVKGKEWLTKVLEERADIDQAYFLKVFSFIEDLPVEHEGEASVLFVKGLEIADELLPLHCDQETIAAALVLPSVDGVGLSDAIVRQLNELKIERLLSGVCRMALIDKVYCHHGGIAKKQIDNLRKMTLALVDDARIVVVKLAERAIHLRYIKEQSDQDRQAVAHQVMSIYAPLANRLGMGQLKWQLEDLSFRYLQIDTYQSISKSLNMRRIEREVFVEKMIEKLAELFEGEHIDQVSITGRAKHIYSIYKKTQRKKVDITKIYDAIALRILVNTTKDCYDVLSMAHAQWPSIPEEFDDYISNPKPNGYQSIHTAVTTENNLNVEIQIRTHEMHEESELGVAAHWKYKEGEGAEQQYEHKLAYLRDLMDWQKEVSEEAVSGVSSQQLYQQLFEDRVYVFTPQGDVFDLPQGATSLDFAYHVHTQVGNRCKGAKVNGKLEPLTFVLKTADQVDVMTGKEDQPSMDWLNPTLGYVVTSQAKSKIKAWFRKERYKEHLAKGSELWEKACRRAKVNKVELKKVYHEFNVKSSDGLLVAMALNDISPLTVIQTIEAAGESVSPDTSNEDVVVSKVTSPHSYKGDVVIEGVGDLLTQMARCCMPIPGDDIVGYVTTGRGVTIHKSDCRNIAVIKEKRSERIVDVQWNTVSRNYSVELEVEVIDRPGIVHDISGVVSADQLSISGLSTRKDKHNDLGRLYVTVEMKSHITLGQLIQHLLAVDDVLHVERR